MEGPAGNSKAARQRALAREEKRRKAVFFANCEARLHRESSSSKKRAVNFKQKRLKAAFRHGK